VHWVRREFARNEERRELGRLARGKAEAYDKLGILAGSATLR